MGCLGGLPRGPGALCGTTVTSWSASRLFLYVRKGDHSSDLVGTRIVKCESKYVALKKIENIMSISDKQL